MARIRVFATRKLPGPGLKNLRKLFSVRAFPEDRAPTREELIEGVKERDGILTTVADKIDGEVMDASDRLKVVSNVAVGFDNIDLKAATERGIYATNTPGVLTETVADFAWALMFAVARRVVEADKFTRAGEWKGWGPLLMCGGDIYGKSLGIVGLGRIGSAVAKRARGFDMRVMYHDIVRKEALEEELGLEYVSLEKLLSESDFVTLHVNLTPQTRHMIGEKELSLMKETAYLINTARGPVVDERALIKALREGTIAGAGLDVFEKEPVSPRNPLMEFNNVVVAPHAASGSVETRIKMTNMAIENLTAVLQGRVPPNLVNKDVLKVRPLA
ncbi:MAG: glyoxylate reductase [Candidatus Bathyarchaeia archaeon]